MKLKVKSFTFCTKRVQNWITQSAQSIIDRSSQTPLCSHLLLIITVSVCNDPDIDVLMYKTHLPNVNHQGTIFKLRTFPPVSCSFTPAAGPWAGPAADCCSGRRWPWYVSSHYSSAALPARRVVTPLQNHTCLQVSAPVELNEINTPAPEQFHRQPQVYIVSDLYSPRSPEQRVSNYG